MVLNKEKFDIPPGGSSLVDSIIAGSLLSCFLELSGPKRKKRLGSRPRPRGTGHAHLRCILKPNHGTDRTQSKLQWAAGQVSTAESKNIPGLFEFFIHFFVSHYFRHYNHERKRKQF